MKVVLLVAMTLALAFTGCSKRMEDRTIEDRGSQQIGEGVYLKKLYIEGGDRVYLLVDENGKLLSTNVSVSITVGSGKHSYTRSSGVLR